MSRKKPGAEISPEELYHEILKLKKENTRQRKIISSILQQIMEIELKLSEPQPEVLRLKAEVMSLAALLDERIEKQSLLPSVNEERLGRFRVNTRRLIIGSRVANVLRDSVLEKKRLNEEDKDVTEEEFRETIFDLEQMLKILENIGRSLNVPGLSREFVKKIQSSINCIGSVLQKEELCMDD